VAELADGGPGVDRDAAHLGRGRAECGPVTLLGDELDRDAGRVADLAALPGAQLVVVDRGTDRDVAQRQGVAGLDVGVLAALDRVTDAQPTRGEDVGLLAVGVVEQRDPAGALRVVLDGGDLGGHAVLVAFEVDHAVALLVAAAAVARRLTAVGVAAAGLGLLGQQRLLGR